jgi:hypothetical protein
MRVGERLATGIYDGSIASDLLKPLHLKLIYMSPGHTQRDPRT